MKAKITMSKSGDFEKSRPHEMEWDDSRSAWVNPHNPSQGIQFIDPDLGTIDPLGWLIGPEDVTGRERYVLFLGAPAAAGAGFVGLVRMVPDDPH